MELIKKTYDIQGFVYFDGFSLNQFLEIKKLIDNETEVKYEKNNLDIRSIYGFQNNNYFRTWLLNQIFIKEIVDLLIGGDVYLHQTKINFKNKDKKSIWPFHRDFPFWNNFDNIKENNLLNVVIFLDDVVEGTGELLLIPKSHKEFLNKETEFSKVEMSLAGSSSSDLLFSFSEEEINYFKEKNGIYKAIGPKGSILVFNPNIVHGSHNSSQNESRAMMILTFNRCENKPCQPSLRPEYLCSTDYKPLRWK